MPIGRSLVARSVTTKQMCSGVWPGVCRTSMRTRPSSISSPSRTSCAPSLFRELVLPIRAALGRQQQCRARLLRELARARDEIGVDVRFGDVGDRELFVCGGGDVSVDVAVRIDDDCESSFPGRRADSCSATASRCTSVLAAFRRMPCERRVRNAGCVDANHQLSHCCSWRHRPPRRSRPKRQFRSIARNASSPSRPRLPRGSSSPRLRGR